MNTKVQNVLLNIADQMDELDNESRLAICIELLSMGTYGAIEAKAQLLGPECTDDEFGEGMQQTHEAIENAIIEGFEAQGFTVDAQINFLADTVLQSSSSN